MDRTATVSQHGEGEGKGRGGKEEGVGLRGTCIF